MDLFPHKTLVSFEIWRKSSTVEDATNTSNKPLFSSNLIYRQRKYIPIAGNSKWVQL